MTGPDEAAVERALAGVRLFLPRVPHRGRVGDVRAASVGSSMEMHDFRLYQPGDDVRHVDWNAVARTGELVLRVRQDEVSPRVEVVLDGSRSMTVSPEKEARARELALLCCLAAARDGLEPSLSITSRSPVRVAGRACAPALVSAELDAADDLYAALSRAAWPRPCGLRVVVSDFLFEAPMARLAERLARGASGLWLLQVLAGEDLEPDGGEGARLLDAESGAALERLLAPAVVAAYLRRLDEHLAQVRAASTRVRAGLLLVDARDSLEAVVRGRLGPLFGARHAGAVAR